MEPSGSFEADQASGQSSQTKDNIGMELVSYNAAAKIEIEDIPKPLNQLSTPNKNTVLHTHLTSPIEISEDSKSESGEPAQAEVNIGMEAKYYHAAAKGDIGDFKDIPNPLDQLLTPNRNTVLHIYLTSLKESESKDSKSKDACIFFHAKDSKSRDSKSSTDFVEGILKKCPSLLWQANVKGETPLHIAARYGHAVIVDVLIGRANAPRQDLESGFDKTVKEMLEMTNNEKDTALHEAVRGNHLEVVKRLIEKGPDFSYSQNDAGETPLYMAVERGFKEVAFHILETCSSPAHDGPLGRTTLHAAVTVHNCGMIQKILEGKTQEQKSALIKQVDKQRWTPLHCAAYFNCIGTRELLKVDRSIAYMKDAKGMTALHIAAHRGHHWVMERILEYCPDCCELVDERGWNALHFVVNSSSSKWAKYDSSFWAKYGSESILKTSLLSNLLNEKDARGNTPLHHHSKSLHYLKDVMCNNRVDRMAFNKQNLNAYDIALTSEELSDKKFMQITRAFIDNRCRAGLRKPFGDDILPKRKDYEDELKAFQAEWRVRKDRFVSIMKETSQYHLVVDTLIATVTFTAGITMPGGFIGQDGPHLGSPVLMRNTTFKAFIITNTIAMVQSCSAAFIQLFMPLLFQDKDPGDFSFLLASLAFCLSISAMGAMVLAFVMGTYAVLMHSLGLAIANSVIGLFFFIPLFFVSIGCSRYLLEILRIGSYWIFCRLSHFSNCIADRCDGICDCIIGDCIIGDCIIGDHIAIACLVFCKYILNFCRRI
ncbi:protein ACCELERATED CELL DEATH 6-like [Castanea sativa]|uniref:protein ACCELERATED CELL DEATH 6-like n=1 Tax=Castanea sativa TaxID=21020 RepID=UPI003F65330B